MLLQRTETAYPIRRTGRSRRTQYEHIYWGDGDKTLVFMSGAGTCSPILDFKSLNSSLSDDYRIVVVEKLGYGFSDVVDESRDIDTILSQTRMAIERAGQGIKDLGNDT